MEIIAKAIARSFGTALFIAIVTTGVLGFLAIPGVALWLAPAVCFGQGEMTSESYNWSSGSEWGTDVTYYCADRAGNPQEVSFGWLFVVGAVLWYGLVMLIVWPLLTVWRVVRWRREERLQQHGVKTLARIVAVEQTSVRVNNQPLRGRGGRWSGRRIRWGGGGRFLM